LSSGPVGDGARKDGSLRVFELAPRRSARFDSSTPRRQGLAARNTGDNAPDVLMTESFAQLFEESLASQKIKPGSILNGRVVEVGPDVVLVNAGLKSEAVIPVEQFKNDRGEIEVNVGDDVEVALDS